ncbi:MAG: serpin family protein [Gemmataceae bacterium]
MVRVIVLLAVLAFLAWPRMVGAREIKSDVASVVKSDNAFGLALYEKLRDSKGNLFFSPYSISTALAMTSAGAKGQTLEEMSKTLQFSLDQTKLSPAFNQLIQSLNGDPKARKYQLNTANALWCQKGYGFEPDFLKLTEKDYHAGLKQVNFADDPEKSRQEINHWVEEQTKDKIKELLKPMMITGDTRLVLTNAIYFKASWLKPFNDKATKEEDFVVGDGKKIANVPLMHHYQECLYTEGDEFQLLQLPYEGSQLEMVIVLPKMVDGLADLEKQLTQENLEKWRSKATTHQVTITLPKFKVTAEFELSNILSKMGMPTAFSKEADFSGITKDEKLAISYVVHKAFVEIDEKGTQAAAATGVVLARPSAVQAEKPRANFRADHPFIYLIRDVTTGSTLFIGRLVDPKAK